MNRAWQKCITIQTILCCNTTKRYGNGLLIIFEIKYFLFEPKKLETSLKYNKNSAKIARGNDIRVFKTTQSKRIKTKAEKTSK